MHVGYVLMFPLVVNAVGMAHWTGEAFFRARGRDPRQNLIISRASLWRYHRRDRWQLTEGLLPVHLLDVEDKVKLGGDEKAALRTLHHLVQRHNVVGVGVAGSQHPLAQAVGHLRNTRNNC